MDTQMPRSWEGGVLATGLVQQVEACHIGLLSLQQLPDNLLLLRLLQESWGEKEKESFGLLWWEQYPKMSQ